MDVLLAFSQYKKNRSVMIQSELWTMCWSDYLLTTEWWNPEVTRTWLSEHSWTHTHHFLKFQSRCVIVKFSVVDTVPEQLQHWCHFSFSVLCRVGSPSWQEFLHCCLRNESFQPWREKQSGIFKLCLSAVPFSLEVHLVNLRSTNVISGANGCDIYE